MGVTASAHANQTPNLMDLYNTIQPVEIEDLGDVDASDVVWAQGRAQGQPHTGRMAPNFDLSAVLAKADQIFNFAKKVWQVVEAGQPVVDIHADRANALPAGLDGWTDLENWQMPKARLFRVTYRNLLRMKVVDFKFRVVYTYGGTIAGKGLYLANVQIVPEPPSVLPLFKFDATAEVIGVTNAGTRADPLAAVELAMTWQATSKLLTKGDSMSFYVRGDGQFSNLKGE